MALPTAEKRDRTGRCATCGHLEDDYEEIDRTRVVALATERMSHCLAGALPLGLSEHAVASWQESLKSHLDRHDLHATAHLLHEVGRRTATAASSLAGAVGEIAVVSVSSGGVPKRPVAAAEIGGRGLTGDIQAERRHHGHPWQAVSLWSLEVIERLAEDGHPIAPGCCGENLTVSGLDWGELRPGVELRAGSALLELTAPATPCKKNARWFVDRDIGRIDHGRHPGWSRWYAAVVEPGQIRRGDPITVVHPA